MKTQRFAPCIWLDDQALAAAGLYTRTFGGSLGAPLHYPEDGPNPSGKAPGSLLAVDFELAGLRMSTLNGGPQFRPGPSISFFAHTAQPAQVDAWYAALEEGGKTLMPLGTYAWSRRYAWLEDRFGVSWQLMAGEAPAPGETVVPCLMFAGKVVGRAEEALRHYASLFPHGDVPLLSRYEPGEGPAGIKHGRATLADQPLIAMDAHAPNEHRFTEGISLKVDCAGQAEIDRLWEALTANGGKPGQCGWLTDRFGVSWQVAPKQLGTWLGGAPAVRDRVFKALMPMGKLDLAVLAAAYAGR